MSWHKLERFSSIIDREDFTYIASKRNGDSLLLAIRLANTVDLLPLEQKKVYDYLSKTESFFEWISIDGIVFLYDAHQLLVDALSKTLAIFRLNDEEKQSVSSSYLRSLTKEFRSGLNKLNQGLRQTFTHLFAHATNVTALQLGRFILDNQIGFGTRYIFNCKGKTAPGIRLLDNDFSKQEIIVIMRFLETKTHVRSSNRGYQLHCLGRAHDAIRIHFLRKKWGRDLIYGIYRAHSSKEHELHEKEWNTAIEQLQFKKCA